MELLSHLALPGVKIPGCAATKKSNYQKNAKILATDHCLLITAHFSPTPRTNKPTP